MSEGITSTATSPRTPIVGHVMLLMALCAGLLGTIYLLIASELPRRTVSVPSADLPAYHIIQESDLITETFKADSIPDDAIDDHYDLVGKYTSLALQAKKPVTDAQVLDPNSTEASEHFVVGISATSAMTLGGNLEPGDVVDIVSTSTGDVAKRSSCTYFENTLVLDVRPVAEHQTTNDAQERPFVIVVALPKDRRTDFANQGAGETWLITRKP